MTISGSFKAKNVAVVHSTPRASRTGMPVLRTLDIECHAGSRKGMNDPEVIMSKVLTSTNLVAHAKALEVATLVIKLVLRVRAPLKSIADQAIRSANSVPANLAEGHGRTGRDRARFWRFAYASAKEVESHLRLLAAIESVDQKAADDALNLFDEVRAMIWRLLHPKS